ncbi:MAG: Crp/Fnr family transcriptional regulator [Cytophagales bacterium]|nr:Crp/Fnr family transcriptional regulator [Cytophagales bacterium]
MHPFHSFISNYVSISNADWQVIASKLEKVEYKRGEMILEQGQVCRKLYFLEEGFLRYFIYKSNGEDATKFFTKAPYCFTSQQSFANNLITRDNIEMLEDAVVWEMKKSDAFELLELPFWNEFVRKLVQEVQYFTEEILQDLQNYTAEERYFHMLEVQDVIIQKSPLKHVASYLGIAPQSLSRIRKNYYLQNRS